MSFPCFGVFKEARNTTFSLFISLPDEQKFDIILLEHPLKNNQAYWIFTFILQYNTCVFIVEISRLFYRVLQHQKLVFHPYWIVSIIKYLKPTAVGWGESMFPLIFPFWADLQNSATLQAVILHIYLIYKTYYSDTRTQNGEYLFAIVWTFQFVGAIIRCEWNQIIMSMS